MREASNDDVRCGGVRARGVQSVESGGRCERGFGVGSTTTTNVLEDVATLAEGGGLND